MKNGRQQLLDKFQKWLISSDPFQRGIAIAALRHAGVSTPDVDSMVIHLLQTESEAANRRDAILFIIDRADPKFEGVLLERLGDEDWHVRGHAIIGLSKINPEFKGLPTVSDFLSRETHPFVRFCAGIM